MSSSPDQEENYMYFYLIFMLILGVGLIVFSLVIWYYKIDVQSKYLLSSMNLQSSYPPSFESSNPTSFPPSSSSAPITSSPPPYSSLESNSSSPTARL